MMGYVILDIEPRAIDAQEWEAAYDETARLLSAWQPSLLGWERRVIEDVDVPVFTNCVTASEGQPSHWCVVGDRESLRTAECHELHRCLARYRSDIEEPMDAPFDIVVECARTGEAEHRGIVRVFGDRTERHPYHFALLAAAMVIEERLPRLAMVSGDIDRDQAETAARLAAPILGRQLPLPVRVEASRLVERLCTGFDSRQLPEAFRRCYLGDDGSHGLVRRASARDVVVDHERAASRASAHHLGSDDTDHLVAIQDVGALGENQALWVRVAAWNVKRAILALKVHPESGGALSSSAQVRRHIAQTIATHGLVITENAWERILAEQDLDTLTWYLALVSLRAQELHQSQVRRALLENPTLLQHTMTVANDTEQMQAVEELVARARAHELR
jgi:hypothetical protein